jgi:transposase (fragment)
LRVNRSTYYKHFFSEASPRIKENQEIARNILRIYTDCDKRLGAYKITHILERDHGINISVGRVYRLIKTLELPKMSTQKPVLKYHSEDHMEYYNHLHQAFNPKSPNMVWASDLTYIKVNGTWYYLCIIMDLFSRKIIAWNLSSKSNAKNS